jgi:hypothetical protein
MNTRAKGNRIRRKAIDMLTRDGFNVAIIERTGRFIFPKDAYGLFDLLAITENNMPLLIQITCNTPHSHKKLKAFSKEYGKYIGVTQLVWKDKKGFTNYVYLNDGVNYVRVEVK